MCYSSVLIKSNAARLTYGNRPYMFVPCGKCFACRSARSDSYYIRTVNEMKSFRKDILALFVLLTYSEDFLPRISEDDFSDVTSDIYGIKARLSKNAPFEIQNDGIIPATDFNEEQCNYLPLDQVKIHALPCFNVSHIDLFFKHLRAKLKKHYGYEPRISYFLVAENGDKFKRPHYHVILFIDIPRYISGVDQLFICKPLIRSCWSVRKFVEPYECQRKDKDGKFMFYRDGRPKTYLRTTRMFQLGIVSFGKKGSPEVIDMENCNDVSRYLSEYLVNDPYFEDVHKANLDQLSPRNKKIYYKKFGPFRLTSQFYGYSAISRLSDNDILNCQVRLEGHEKPYPMPLYYQRYVYENKITYQSCFDHKPFYHNYNKKVPYRCNISRLPFHGYGERYLPLSSKVDKVIPKYRSVVSKNDNWKRMRKHKFREMYESLLSSFNEFRNWILNDSSEISPVMWYSEYLLYNEAYINMSSRCRCGKLYHDPNLSRLRLWIKLISSERLLGYYLILFNYFSYDSAQDPFSTPKALFNLNYTHDHLDSYDFVSACYSDFIDKSANSHFLDRTVSSRARKLQVWQLRFEYLCIAFQSYQHFVLFRRNENKISDWNVKAKELGKAKFLIQPH